MNPKIMLVKLRWCASAVLALLPAILLAQDTPVSQSAAGPEQLKAAPVQTAGATDQGPFNQILQTGCASCGAGLLGAGPSYLSGGGCCGDNCDSGCYPGRKGCAPCEGNNCVSRMLCGLHDCLCCPDPCYEPRWIAAANSAFFVDGARPVSQMRLRWDANLNVREPDRAEYLWAKIGGKGPAKPETSLDYNSLAIYNEAAVEKFSVFTEIPYLSMDPQQNLGAGGFGDLKIGTKSLLLDCELIQTTFQFTTGIPTGNFKKGLGVGHVWLEPTLLTAIKLSQDTYFQGQLSQYIPIGGTSGYAGSILHYHVSLNHVLCRPVADTQLIGTMEFNGYSFQSGSYTDPVLGTREANGYTYMSIGPGLRYVICDKIDIGVGSAFSMTGQHFADQLYRTEFRWRF